MTSMYFFSLVKVGLSRVRALDRTYFKINYGEGYGGGLIGEVHLNMVGLYQIY